MVSKAFMICDAYESGYGHGYKRDGLDLSKTPFDDPELGEAYQHGYEEGEEHSKHLPYTLDREALKRIANQAFGETVDCDLIGNPITDYDVLLNGAYGPAVARLCNLVLSTYGSTNVCFPIPGDTES